jgi:hypothetical protein
MQHKTWLLDWSLSDKAWKNGVEILSKLNSIIDSCNYVLTLLDVNDYVQA